MKFEHMKICFYFVLSALGKLNLLKILSLESIQVKNNFKFKMM